MALLKACSTFEVTMAAEKGDKGDKGDSGYQGAKALILYWDECESGFQFLSGKNGEEFFHIVFESRSRTDLNETTCYLCVASHTKTSTKPQNDPDHWTPFSNMALIATDLMLARKILAREIDVDNLVVKHVNAVSSDSQTTCQINGDTGKLTAKNVDIEGKFTSNEGSIGGFDIASGRLGYNPFPSVLDGTSYVNMTKGAFNAWSEYFNTSSGYTVSKESILTAGSVQTSITDSRTGYYQEHVACKFISCKYGLKVTNTGVYITSDGGSTWTLIGVN